MSDSSGAEAPRPPNRRYTPTCQVKGCTNPFPEGVSYHRRYRVCQHHSSLPQLVLNAQVARWCQQCGKFQDISDFDGARKTCRVKLVIHNAQRKAARERRRGGSTATERSNDSRGTQSLQEEGLSSPRRPRGAEEPLNAAAPGLPLLSGNQEGPFDALDIEALLESIAAEQAAAEGQARRYDAGGAASLMAMAAGLKRTAWDAISQPTHGQQPNPGIALPATFAAPGVLSTTAMSLPGSTWLPQAHLGGWNPPPPPPPPLRPPPPPQIPSAPLAPAATTATAAPPNSDDIYQASMRLFGVPPSALPQEVVDSLAAVLVAKGGENQP